MRIALINYNFSPILNTGLASIIATLRDEGHDVRLIDLAFTPRGQAHDVVIAQLGALCPDAIGVSVVYEYAQLMCLIRRIRHEVGTQPLLVGGLLPTSIRKVTGQFQDADIENVWTFTGTANEETALFLRDYERGRLPSSAHVRGTPRDPNDLPIPDYRLFDMPRYFKDSIVARGYFPLSASQGCPFDCSFCNLKAMPYVHKRPQRILEEVRVQESRHKQHGMRCLNFSDHTFGFQRKYFEEMMMLFYREGLHERFPWLCQTRPEVVTKDWALKAAKSGCFLVNLGLENSMERVRRDILNKQYSNEQFRQAIDNLNNAGIWYSFNLVGGVPGTSFWTDIKSVMFATTFSPAGTLSSAYYPAEGTRLRESVYRGEDNPCISSSARLRALVQNLISIPPTMRAGIAHHGLHYLAEFLDRLLNLTGKRSFSLSQLLTYPFLAHQILHRPMYDLQIDKCLENQKRDLGSVVG